MNTAIPISPVQPIEFLGHKIWLKRDDLIDCYGVGFNGNKARKLWFYLNQELPHIRRLVSTGSAQSNMLFSLSCLAKQKGWELDFYVDHIAEDLQQRPRGNYLAALNNGANIQALGRQTLVEKTRELALLDTPDTLYIPEGGSHAAAEPGLQLLAEEITQWAAENQMTDLKVMLPSGTGTTAFFLQRHLPFPVLTCACVGSDQYLQQEFEDLATQLKVTDAQFPEILATSKKYHFGKCYKDLYDIWQQLTQATGIEFDLLYDPQGWQSLLLYLAHNPSANILYVHQGGLLGNQSMLDRYKRKFLK